jgi:hypothetical protein
MQFIEKNSFNVRSAVYRLTSDRSTLEFILFPMIHVGSKQFYDEMRMRITKCDLILVEGVKTKKAALLTISYSVVKKIKRMELVTQQDALRLSELPLKIINSDMSGQNFDKGWVSLPLSLRALFVLLIPLYVIYLFLFGTRNYIARNMTLNDLPSRDEILNTDEDFEKLDALMIDARDKHLITVIEKLLSEKGGERKTIGIVYGARHMRNIVLYLQKKQSYKIAGAEWVTVFDL